MTTTITILAIIGAVYLIIGFLICIGVILGNIGYRQPFDWRAVAMIAIWPVIYFPRRKNPEGDRRRRAEYRAALAVNYREVEALRGRKDQ